MADPAHKNMFASDAWVGIGVVEVGVENGAAVAVDPCADTFKDAVHNRTAKVRSVKIFFIRLFFSFFIEIEL